MFHLIKKDLLIQKRSLKLSILLMIFLSITLSSLGPVGLSLGVLAVTYQLVLGASATEEQNNSDIILISLPIMKKTVVLSKYISMYLYTGYAISGFFLIYIVTKLLNLPFSVPYTNHVWFVALVAVTIYGAISFPLIFKFGYLESKMANLIIFLVFAMGSTAFSEYLRKNSYQFLGYNLTDTFQNQSQLMIMIPLILLLIASYFVSLHFYTNREF